MQNNWNEAEIKDYAGTNIKVYYKAIDNFVLTLTPCYTNSSWICSLNPPRSDPIGNYWVIATYPSLEYAFDWACQDAYEFLTEAAHRFKLELQRQ
jgi:hypothetical protein